MDEVHLLEFHPYDWQLVDNQFTDAGSPAFQCRFIRRQRTSYRAQTKAHAICCRHFGKKFPGSKLDRDFASGLVGGPLNDVQNFMDFHAGRFRHCVHHAGSHFLNSLVSAIQREHGTQSRFVASQHDVGAGDHSDHELDHIAITFGIRFQQCHGIREFVRCRISGNLDLDPHRPGIIDSDLFKTPENPSNPSLAANHQRHQSAPSELHARFIVPTTMPAPLPTRDFMFHAHWRIGLLRDGFWGGQSGGTPLKRAQSGTVGSHVWHRHEQQRHGAGFGFSFPGRSKLDRAHHRSLHVWSTRGGRFHSKYLRLFKSGNTH